MGVISGFYFLKNVKSKTAKKYASLPSSISEDIKQKWNEHLSRKRNWGKYSWPFLIFRMWFKIY